MSVGRDLKTVLEPLRRQTVGSMRQGETMVLAYGTVAPHFSEWRNSSFFDPELLFDFPNWRKDESFMKVVTAEDTANTGGVFVCQE